MPLRPNVNRTIPKLDGLLPLSIDVAALGLRGWTVLMERQNFPVYVTRSIGRLVAYLL